MFNASYNVWFGIVFFPILIITPIKKSDLDLFLLGDTPFFLNWFQKYVFFDNIQCFPIQI